MFILLSAVLFYLASPNVFSPLGFPVFAWVFAIFLFSVLEGRTISQRLLIGMVFGLTAYALILAWIINVNVFLFFVFTCLFAVQPVMFAVLAPVHFFFAETCPQRSTWWLRENIKNIFFISSVWTFTEAVRTFLIGGFAWTIGHSQTFRPELIQIADIVGAYGVSFVILVVNGCVYALIRDRRNRTAYGMIGVGIVALVTAYGMMVMRSPDGASRYTVCTIQPNISSKDKLNSDLTASLVDRQLILTRQCLQDTMPDLVVWPETAVTDDIVHNDFLNQKIRSFIQEYPTRMLIGSAMLIDGENYNSAVLFGMAGQVSGVYHKRHLLPFHEYFPLREWSVFLQNIFGLKNYDFQNGTGSATLALDPDEESGVFGVAICSEEGYPEIIRDAVLHNAEFLVAMLNDAWFKSNAAVMMHAQNGVMQAAAFKIPVIRSTNSGLSCVIDKYGRIRSTQGSDRRLDQSAVFSFVVDGGHSSTFYARHRNLFVFLCGFFSLMLKWNRHDKGEQ